MADRSRRAGREDPAPVGPGRAEGEGAESPPTSGVPRRGRARGRSASREREGEEAEQALAEPSVPEVAQPHPLLPPQVAGVGEPPRGISPTDIIRGLRIHGGSPELQIAGRHAEAGGNGHGPNGNGPNGNGGNGPNGNGRSPGGGPGRPDQSGRRGTRFGARPAAPAANAAAVLDVVQSRENHEKVGTSGDTVRLYGNFYHVRRRDKWCLYHYRVDFIPEIDHIGTRKALLREHQGNLPAYIFDGASLHTADLIADNMLELVATRRARRGTETGEPQEEALVQIRLQFVAQLEETDGMYLQFYSIMARKCLQNLKLALLGRNYFDPNMAIQLPNHRLQIWPGFLTTMRTHDAGLLYGVQTLHKVIRTDDVWSMMRSKKQELQNMERVKEALMNELLGTIVITHYNKRTYRIDDISWNEKPSSTFPLRNNTQISYLDYYKSKHDITIRTENQPLLVSNPTKRDLHRGQTQPVKLIPELCYMTGLSETMRQNFNLMREMGQHLFQTPDKKVQTMTNFMERVQTTPEVQHELTGWGLNIQDGMVKIKGRKLPIEQVQFKDQRSEALKPFEVDPVKGDFTNAFRSARLVSCTALQTWVLIVPQRDAAGIDNLLQTMQRVSRPLGFVISQPTEVVSLQSNSIESNIRAINDAINKYEDRLQMVFTILPNNKLDLYAAIKRRCYVDSGLPSQCFLAKNVGSKGLMSIATKLTVQMSCKLGGEAWQVKIPLANLMVVGFDVHHGAVGSRSASFGAMVTTLSPTLGKYFSTVMEAQSREEVIGSMAGELGKCVSAWRKENGRFPERIMFYRDGVGEGQLQAVYAEELVSIKKMLQALYKAEGLGLPKFTYVVVTKRINHRFFTAAQPPQNPLPGTIVDTVVTFPERYDFYLIAQSVRQGTVSPTSYNVLFDRSALDADKIQRITFKLCNLYYNFSGTVAVPATCQYAHKLAFMAGTAMRSNGHEKLSRQLYFL